jgi:hypothetical protein
MYHNLRVRFFLSLVILVNLTSMAQVTNNFSVINIHINSFKKDIVSIWMNDSLVYKEISGKEDQIRLILYSNGQMNFTTQLGDYLKTKNNIKVKIETRKIYNLHLDFFDKNSFCSMKIDTLEYFSLNPINFQYVENIKNLINPPKSVIDSCNNYKDYSEINVSINLKSFYPFGNTKIWFNDFLVFDYVVNDAIESNLFFEGFGIINQYKNLRFLLYSQGEIIIKAQFRDEYVTTTYYKLNIKSNDIYYLSIEFKDDISNGIIKKLQEPVNKPFLANYQFLEEFSNPIIPSNDSLPCNQSGSDYSTINFIIDNAAFKDSPVMIWVNDKPIFWNKMNSHDYIYYGTNYKGNFKITAQYGDYKVTNAVYESNISPGEQLFINITFMNISSKADIEQIMTPQFHFKANYYHFEDKNIY